MIANCLSIYHLFTKLIVHLILLCILKHILNHIEICFCTYIERKILAYIIYFLYHHTKQRLLIIEWGIFFQVLGRYLHIAFEVALMLSEDFPEYSDKLYCYTNPFVPVDLSVNRRVAIH